MVVSHLCLIIKGPGALAMLEEGAGLVKSQIFSEMTEKIKIQGANQLYRATCSKRASYLSNINWPNSPKLMRI